MLAYVRSIIFIFDRRATWLCYQDLSDSCNASWRMRGSKVGFQTPSCLPRVMGETVHQISHLSERKRNKKGNFV